MRNTGNKAMGTSAKELEELRILPGRFPMMRHNGHPWLSPEKLVRYIASDPKIREIIVFWDMSSNQCINIRFISQ